MTGPIQHRRAALIGEPITIRAMEFSPGMVRALLAGRKHQTRRLASSPHARAQRGDLRWVAEAIEILRAPPKGPIAIRYRADDALTWIDWPDRIARPAVGERAGRFMPMECARLTLVVTDVTPQRLHAISEHDAIEEGIETIPARPAFLELWDTLHTKPGERAEDNPEVVALGFLCLARPPSKIVAGSGHGGVR